jgi:hypothetical protein
VPVFEVMFPLPKTSLLLPWRCPQRCFQQPISIWTMVLPVSGELRVCEALRSVSQRKRRHILPMWCGLRSLLANGLLHSEVIHYKPFTNILNKGGGIYETHPRVPTDRVTVVLVDGQPYFLDVAVPTKVFHKL